MFHINDVLVGRRVSIDTGCGEYEFATIVAVSDKTCNIKVQTDDGEVLIGSQWDDV
jgi:hypothetical protein